MTLSDARFCWALSPIIQLIGLRLTPGGAVNLLMWGTRFTRGRVSGLLSNFFGFHRTLFILPWFGVFSTVSRLCRSPLFRLSAMWRCWLLIALSLGVGDTCSQPRAKWMRDRCHHHADPVAPTPRHSCVAGSHWAQFANYSMLFALGVLFNFVFPASPVIGHGAGTSM